MEAYGDFAEVYDIFMDEVPYRLWCDKLQEWMECYGISKPVKYRTAGRGDLTEEKKLQSERDLVLDLGCGTGTLTELMATRGYDMIGLDLSPEMLRAAVDKKAASGHEILYLCQDMREFELYSTVGCILCICDSLNYLLSAEDVIKTFRTADNYLYPGGIMIFDFNTIYKYETVIGDTTIAENRADCSFIWENYYHAQEGINEYDITVFLKTQEELFRRFTENHYQRGYTLTQMKEYLAAASLGFVAAFDGDTFGEVQTDSERIFVIAREQSKQPVS